MQVRLGVPLAGLTTLGVGGPADRLVEVEDAAEQQQRASGLVGLADGGHEFRGVLDLDQPVRRAADAERGEAGERYLE